MTTVPLEVFSLISRLLPAALKESNFGSAFCFGSVNGTPHIRPKALRRDSIAPNPIDWSESDFEKVKVHLNQAPFGKGAETVVDKQVRNALEIAADQLTIDNRAEWNALLDKAVKQSTQILATSIDSNAVHAEFYKMVVYGEGGHFKAHRDTQRSDTHFGTMVIILPSKAQGGELVLRHGGLQESISMPTGKKRSTWVSYFADIEHEVKPVLKGHRISLLYHLHRDTNVVAPACPAPSIGTVQVQELSAASAVASSSSTVDFLVAQFARLKGIAPGKRKSSAISSSSKSTSKKSDSAAIACGETSFLGYVCQHLYAGKLNSDSLKGADAACFHLFAPHFPGTRLAHIEIQLHGATHPDAAEYVTGPEDFHFCVVDIDEVKPGPENPPFDPKRFQWSGSLMLKKVTSIARPLCSFVHGDAGDFDGLYDFKLGGDPISHVRFLNDDGDVYTTVVRAKMADADIQGSGNEGSASAFLYKRVAILIPLVPDAGTLRAIKANLGDFDPERGIRELPEYLP